ncbi:MAG: hypothetical protein HN855_15965 [Anaerolineae bacterium]|jgi:tetratricopeptide (TPR) repeat protein|nr:hypothetical protein [Anaerolineae bacterium]MBT7073128.1 hypothetical protein [Anaerolineae bacterium]MBT7326646.1 hypothetical protein [Anaerolineae bacterium]
MSRQDRLQVAIAKAKAGHELSARDLFLDIVHDEPDNKLAWLWLVGLLDNTDDLISACENILRIGPADARVQRRLGELRRTQKAQLESWTDEKLREASSLLKDGEIDFALIRLREILKKVPRAERALALLAKYSPDLNEQVQALKDLSVLDPQNEQKRAVLERLHYFKEHPLELAALYEERGEWDKAIKVFDGVATNTSGRREWDHVMREVSRLEYLQKERIAYVSPLLSIIRLTAGPPLLFFFLIVTQVGYDFSYFTLVMGLELLAVVAGAFLLALATIGGEHTLWRRLGNAAGRATKPLRLLVGVVGMLIILLPFVLLGIEAVQRWYSVFDYLGFEW